MWDTIQGGTLLKELKELKMQLTKIVQSFLDDFQILDTSIPNWIHKLKIMKCLALKRPNLKKQEFLSKPDHQ